MLADDLNVELLKRRAMSFKVTRTNFLKWTGASLVCWLTGALALASIFARPSVSGRIIHICVSLAFLSGAVVATVIAFLRYRDWRFVRMQQFH